MPSPEAVKNALELIRKRPANHDYFFSRLTSPDWIGPLDEAGLFSSPPPASRDGETVRLPFWPESQYLERVASAAPEQVAEVMMKIPETDNVRVIEDLAHAASKLPGGLAAQWSKQAIAWIEKQDDMFFLLPDALGELIVHLANSGEPNLSLALAKAALTVRTVGNSRDSIAAHLSTWNYKELLEKYFPEVLRHTTLEGLALLCDLLEGVLARESDDAHEDYSEIWRPAIEPHPQNLVSGNVRNFLVDAIRDGSLQLIQEGLELDVIVRALLERRHRIFKRIALHLLAENHEHQTARELASNRDNFFDNGVRHEYSRLLTAVFSDLDDDAKSSILGWIEEGPPPGELEGDEPPETRRRQKAHWQACRLFGLRGQLPEEWERHYSDIASELGEAEYPDFVSYTTTRIGPTSPKEAYELEAMSPEQIASFLKSWEPSDALDAPEPEGLARTLETVVANSPDRFVAKLDLFHAVEPRYACAVIRGLSEAIEAGSVIDWRPIVEYLAWVAHQPRNETRDPSKKPYWDTHWGWARKASVSLLSAGFEKNSVDFTLREAAWEVIDMIADDPDPTTEDDAKSTMAPATRSINTTRGEALHAVMQYALWVARELSRGGTGAESRNPDWGLMPEVRLRLERHLDRKLEPSPAVRAVFGRWFPWLWLLDRAWAEAKVETIFPLECPALRDAAWHSYLAFCRVYDEPFRVLREQYSAGVDHLTLSSEETPEWIRSTAEHLGVHLMVMVGRGVLHWSDEDALVKRFFEKAAIADASQAIAFIGRSLGDRSNHVSDDVVNRFCQLWEELKKFVSASSTERAQFLRPFGWWFVSERLTVEWAFGQLTYVIEKAGGITPDVKVMEKLADLASAHPARTLEIFKALARRDVQGWNLLGWKDSARTVLRAALDQSATKSDAESFIHELGARNYFQFRDLLSN